MARQFDRIRRLEAVNRWEEASELVGIQETLMERARTHPAHGEEFRETEAEIAAILQEHGGDVGEAMRADFRRYRTALSHYEDLFHAIKVGREPHGDFPEDQPVLAGPPASDAWREAERAREAERERKRAASESPQEERSLPAPPPIPSIPSIPGEAAFDPLHALRGGGDWR